MRKTYLRITTEGVIEPLIVEGDELRALQQAVGGIIAGAPAPEGHTLYVHDEGLLLGFDLNFIASQIASQPLVGDAVLVGPVDDEGETASVDPRFRQLLGC